MKRLLNYRKVEILVLTFCLLMPVILWGCGKDDKDVTQNPMSSPSTYGVSDTKYLNAKPLDLKVTFTATQNIVTWDAPSETDGLIGYRVYVSSLGKQPGIFENGSADRDIFETTNAIDGFSYTYYVTSVFSVYDSTYKFYSEIESLPTAPKTIDRP